MVLADALFDNFFVACELRQRGIELVVRIQAERVVRGLTRRVMSPDAEDPSQAQGKFIMLSW